MDRQLGENLETIPLRGKIELVTIVLATVLAIVVFLVAFLLGSVSRPASIVAGGIGLLLLVSTLVSVYVASGELSKVAVHENGLLLQSRQEEEVILWDDIDGVQTDLRSEVRIRSFRIPIFIPFGIGFLYGWTNVRKPYHFYSGYVVLHLRTGDTRELLGDERLFSLRKLLNENVMVRLISEVKQRFENGEVIPLAEGVQYSQDGIKGMLVRETRHSRREIPIDLAWEQITGLRFTERSFRISATDYKTVIMSIREMINLQAFLAVLKSLNAKGRIPRVQV